MNRAKWQRRAELDTLTREQWLAKLTEELGEVAREVTDLMEDNKTSFIDLRMELEHVEFIAMCFRLALITRDRARASR